MVSFWEQSGVREWVAIFLVLILVIFSFGYVSYDRAQRNNFQSYFGIDPHSISSSDRALAVPLVNIKLTQLLMAANDDLDAVAKIRNEQESVVVDALKERLERIKTAEDKAKNARADFQKACEAAIYEDFINECISAK